MESVNLEMMEFEPEDTETAVCINNVQYSLI
jgi:hypothetical protein